MLWKMLHSYYVNKSFLMIYEKNDIGGNNLMAYGKISAKQQEILDFLKTEIF